MPELFITSPSTLTPLRAVISQIARQLGVPVGFENTRDCGVSPKIDQRLRSESLPATTAREAFEYVATLMPNYSWTELDSVVVFRPDSAWKSTTDVSESSSEIIHYEGRTTGPGPSHASSGRDAACVGRPRGRSSRRPAN